MDYTAAAVSRGVMRSAASSYAAMHMVAGSRPVFVIAWEGHIGLALLCGCSGALEYPTTNSCGPINKSLSLSLSLYICAVGIMSLNQYMFFATMLCNQTAILQMYAKNIQLVINLMKMTYTSFFFLVWNIGVQAHSQAFLSGRGGGSNFGTFMITRGLSYDRVGFGHFLGVWSPPPPPPTPGYGPGVDHCANVWYHGM